MKTIKNLIKIFISKIFFQKIFAYLLLIIAFYFLKDFLLLFFTTFLFSYLFLTFGNYLKLKIDFLLDKFICKKNFLSSCKKFLSLNFIITFVYLTFIFVLFFSLSDLLPKLTKELKELPKYVPLLSGYVDVVASKLEEIRNINTQIGGSISEIVSKQDLDLLIQIFDRLKAFGAIFFKIILSLILSYIFIIDRDKLFNYLKGIEKSNFGFLYVEYTKVISKIVDTFGLVFKAQSIIALVNAFLTTVGLFIIGIIHSSSFPFIYTLAIIVFICGFIPVLGTFISSIPIIIIGYSSFGSIPIIFEIILLIGLIHTIEAYYLNPKIVSSFIHLPVSLTFLVLILSEHFMGFAGLVIGISSFYLILELFKEFDKIITTSTKKYNEIKQIENQTKQEIKTDLRVSRKI